MTGRPEKYCALHFANLVWALNVVEILAHAGTAPATLEAVTQFAIEIGQVPVPVQKEQNGYLLNSWLMPLMQASLTLVSTGVATHQDVDRTYLIVNKGTSMGPFAIIDVVGMNTMYAAFQYWGTVKDDQEMLNNAAFLKENFLDKGLQGALGGQGFYSYPNPEYAEEGFVDVPDIAAAAEIARRAILA